MVSLPGPLLLQVSSHIQVLARKKQREFATKAKVGCLFRVLPLCVLLLLAARMSDRGSRWCRNSKQTPCRVDAGLCHVCVLASVCACACVCTRDAHVPCNTFRIGGSLPFLDGPAWRDKVRVRRAFFCGDCVPVDCPRPRRVDVRADPCCTPCCSAPLVLLCMTRLLRVHLLCQLGGITWPACVRF